MKLVLVIISFCFLYACTALADEGDFMTNGKNIDITIGQPISELLSTSPIPFETDCLIPVQICWYKIQQHFSSSVLPSVNIRSLSAPLLHLNDVATVNIVIDEKLGRDIRAVNLAIRGLPDDSTHADQKTFIYKTLQEIIHAGWNHFYSFSDPRIPGAEADKLPDPNRLFGKPVLAHPWFDPRYEFSLDKWLKADHFFHWQFYKKGHYLEVTVQRANSRESPTEHGTYLISMELMSEDSYWRQHFSEEHKNEWTVQLPRVLKQYHEERTAQEEKARAAGIRIEEDYQDPCIHGLFQQ